MAGLVLRLSAALSVVMVLVGGAAGQQVPASVPVPLEEGAAGPVPDRIGELVWRGTLHLRNESRYFGGLSSLRVSPDGSQFVALNDRGMRVTGRMLHDGAGHLTGAGDFNVAPLLGTDGQALPNGGNDTEGLAMFGPWPGDGWAVSMEGRNVVLRYPPALAGAPAVEMAVPAGLHELPLNLGIETLLTLADGRLLMIAEDEGAGDRHRVWVGNEGQWVETAYQGLSSFLPVDAARLPDGGILVLERRSALLGSWGSRVVYVDAAALAAGLKPGALVQGREIARLESPLVVDNYEGIDTATLPDGSIAVYIIADDNFRREQRTLLTLFAWRH